MGYHERGGAMTPQSTEEQKVTKLHLSGSRNSTLFTNCCGLAVTREEWKCPGCGALIEVRHWGKTT